MRSARITKIDDELYEIERTIKIDKFNRELTSEDVLNLKEWLNVERIYKSVHTNEYLFVNKIETLEIEEN
jgi:hypothetical protein